MAVSERIRNGTSLRKSLLMKLIGRMGVYIKVIDSAVINSKLLG